MIEITPYLYVENGKKAIKLYQDVFDAKLLYFKAFDKETGKDYGLPEDYNYEDSTMHATLSIDGGKIYLSDDIGEHKFEGHQKVGITLDVNNEERVREIYEKVQEKEFRIDIKLQETFWADLYTKFEDSEGIIWQVYYNDKEGLENRPKGKKKKEK
jgi:PhnB protein